MKSSRKASLDLSVNSIVVMVIAFVVLGLILAFTRGIFNNANKNLGDITNIVDLSEKPDVENPIVPKSMNLVTGTAGQSVTMGFYNGGSTPAHGVMLVFGDCIGTDSNDDPVLATAKKKPVITMNPTGTVQPSKGVGIRALVSTKASVAPFTNLNPEAKALGNGNYICPITAYQTKKTKADGTLDSITDADIVRTANILATAQISVKVG